MRLIAALFLLATSASAASFSLDIGATYRAVKHAHDKVPASTRWRRATGIIAFAGNGIDWGMTRAYAGPGGGGCEQNKRLTTAPCVLDVPKLDRIKLTVAVGLVVEEGIHRFLLHKAANDDTAAGQLRWLKRANEAEKIGVIVNVPLDVIYGVLTVHNVISASAINAKQ